MKKAWVWLLPIVIIALGVAGYVWFAAGSKAPEIDYRTAAVEKKRIVGRITASGTLQAVVTVQVGSQVSGRVQTLFADFNSTVKKGQLVAKIDPQLFQAAVAQASANHRAARAAVAQATAQSKNADRQLERLAELYKQGLATQIEFDTAKTAAEVAKSQIDSAKAQVDQAAAALSRAKVDLSYTDILSPIDGVVISRSVDVGQTVAASLQAPVIFTIAEDLRKMQVNTNISEGDVGRLQQGMAASFTVDAFPGQRFRGTIAQIRNAATTVQNVVTYNAVIDVANSELKLRPGMTANVTIIYAEREDVLAVPNQALRFRAPPELAGTTTPSASGPGRSRNRDRASADAPPPPDVSGAPSASAVQVGSADAPASSGTGRPRDRGDGGWNNRTVWVLRQGKAEQVNIQVGLTDGTSTELTGGDLKEGDQVVTDATVKGASTSSTPPAGLGGPQRRMF
ncbi:MAG: efflux RND transporter periplasmic adaptor subunit [Polyangiaceae bacterium]|nr:efflux RND transporter periplasmic adaptor subunit [Polyangiaceae bacterium]